MTTSMFMLFTATILIIVLSQQQYVESTDLTGYQVTEVLQESFPCPPWYIYHHEDLESCKFKQCHEPEQLPSELRCSDTKGAQVEFGYCITYDKIKQIFEFGSCHFFQAKQGHRITEQGYVKLPDNVSELNDYMCGLMKRKGPLCTECFDGFGPALTSTGFTCSDCTNAWYGVPLYLLVEFGPITLLYFIILTFQIDLTSAPMTCFILYSQVIFFELQYDRRPPVGRLTYQLQGIKLTVLKVVYGTMNMEILHFIVPPFCVSSNLQLIHISFLEYLPAFYPLFLILLTWICIELHGRNFRLLVWAWIPFHRCFVRLRRGWSARSDLVDVFASFFLLSFSKIMFQSLIIIDCQPNHIFYDGNISSTSNTYSDPSRPCNTKKHAGLSALAAIFLSVFIILPTFLLMFYPIKAVRVCLSKCKLDGFAVTTFVDKFHGCYRDGLDGGKDMRSLSGLYFFVRIFVFVIRFTVYLFIPNIWLCYTLLYTSTALLIAFAKPYKKTYMNIFDTILLANLSALCLLLTSENFKNQAVIVYILMLLPIVSLTVLATTKIIHNKVLKKVNLKSIIFQRFDRNTHHNEIHSAKVHISNNNGSELSDDSLERLAESSNTVSSHDNERTPLLMYGRL